MPTGRPPEIGGAIAQVDGHMNMYAKPKLRRSKPMYGDLIWEGH